jgi:hypothetical protein
MIKGKLKNTVHALRMKLISSGVKDGPVMEGGNNPKPVHCEKVHGNESLSDRIDNISDNVFAQL